MDTRRATRPSRRPPGEKPSSKSVVVVVWARWRERVPRRGEGLFWSVSVRAWRIPMTTFAVIVHFNRYPRSPSEEGRDSGDIIARQRRITVIVADPNRQFPVPNGNRLFCLFVSSLWRTILVRGSSPPWRMCGDDPSGKLTLVIKCWSRLPNFCAFPKRPATRPLRERKCRRNANISKIVYVLHDKDNSWLHIPCAKYYVYVFIPNIMIMHRYIVSIMHWNIYLEWQRIFIPHGKLISLDVFYRDTCVFSFRCVGNLFKVCCLQRLLLVNSMNK